MGRKLVLVTILVIVALGVFVGCSTTNRDGSPKWTTNPPTHWRTYYAVGYGKLSNQHNSRMRAEAVALDIIARWTGTTVDSALTNYINDTGDESIEMMENISKQVVKISLRGAVIEEQWTAPDGGVYVLVSFPIKNLKEAYKEQSAALERDSEIKKSEILIEYLEKELAKEGK